MVSPDYHKNQGKGVEHAQSKSDFGRQQYLKQQIEATHIHVKKM